MVGRHGPRVGAAEGALVVAAVEGVGLDGGVDGRVAGGKGVGGRRGSESGREGCDREPHRRGEARDVALARVEAIVKKVARSRELTRGVDEISPGGNRDYLYTLSLICGINLMHR